LRGEALERAIGGAIAAVGLAGRERENPYDLGFSERKLLTIASVLAMATPVIVLDEPTTGQDSAGVRAVESVVERLAGEGRTVIGISHDLRFVADNFERVIVMREGRVAMDGTPAEAFAEQAWPVLASTNLEPPYAARIGAALGLGSTHTEAALIAAIASSADRR
jgi:energy-coupling factor transport system ATP-binding protein